MSVLQLPAVCDADGRPLSCPAAASPDETVAEWLAAGGHALNTRCGGRGLCHGCEVVVPKDGAGKNTLKACQTLVSALSGSQITVPKGSLHDRTITGVSAFDITAHLEALGHPRLNGGVGVAVDVGTTTLAVALWAGLPAECLATATAPNPQARFGDNVVSRIQFSLDHADGNERLHRTLVEQGVRPLIESACAAAGIGLADIVLATVSGNPAMLHTVASAPLEGLSTYPFSPKFLDQRCLTGAVLGLNPEIPVELLASIGPFVGSDVSAGALACGLLDAKPPALLIDFGTNGEILLKTATGYLATATAAGPAFEGGRLACGAMAGHGVVGGIEGWDADRKVWSLRVAKGEATSLHGIAGAAYVDFLALGLEAGILSETGRFDPEHQAIRVIESEEPGAGRCCTLTNGVFISEADVAELIQAKAAIQAGWVTLLDEAGLQSSDLTEVMIAGGFGYHLTPAHAVAIGLLPQLADANRYRLVGNSSLGGASLALIGNACASRIAGLRNEVKLVELNTTDSFEDHYIDAMLLKWC